MARLSVTIITKNEAADIEAALSSVAWADEIVVVDSQSTDRTAALAAGRGARVIARPWPGYVAQKNFAASQASHDWILSLDADERVTPPLAEEIRTLLDGAPARQGYWIPRVTWHLGRWIRSTDWYPDLQLRLYDRRAAQWTGRYVHEGVAVNGSVGRLRHELQHFAYRDIADHLETMDRYTTLAARQMHEDGRRASALGLALHPPFAFVRNYVLKGGFRDGTAGLIVSAMNAYYVLLKFAKLWEIQTTKTRTPEGTPDVGPRTGEWTSDPGPRTPDVA